MRRLLLVLAVAAFVAAAPAAAFVPADPLAPKQWYLLDDHAFDAWTEPPPLAPVKVAVVDSGVDCTLPMRPDASLLGKTGSRFDYTNPATSTDDPHFAGNFSFFHHAMPGHADTGNFFIDVTQVVKRLGLASGTIDVTVMLVPFADHSPATRDLAVAAFELRVAKDVIERPA